MVKNNPSTWAWVGFLLKLESFMHKAETNNFLIKVYVALIQKQQCDKDTNKCICHSEEKASTIHIASYG